jgi:hypothetical protein
MTSRYLCAKVVQQYFLEFYLFFIFRPSDMQEYIFMLSIALEWTYIPFATIKSPIDAVKFSNTIQLTPK